MINNIHHIHVTTTNSEMDYLELINLVNNTPKVLAPCGRMCTTPCELECPVRLVVDGRVQPF